MAKKVTLAEVEARLGQGDRAGRGERRFSCPRCGTGDPKDRTFSVNSIRQFFLCYRCNFGEGKVLAGLFTAMGWERSRGASSVDLPEPKEKKKPTRVPKKLKEAFCPLDLTTIHAGRNPIAAEAYRYLVERRGLTDDVIRSAGLGYGAQQTPWFGYVLFPVVSSLRKGKLLYYSGRRYIDDGMMPQKNPANRTFPVDAGEIVFGQERAPLLGWGVLCEAPLDALKVGPFALASYGKKLSTTQAEVLAGLGLRKLVVLYDREPEAQAAAWEIARMLFDEFPGGAFVAVPRHGDPGASSYDENRLAVLRAVHATADNHMRAASGGWFL